MSDNKPDLKFTHLSDSNNDLEFTNFRPNTLLNFNEVWQPSTQLEFDKTGGSDVKKDVSVFISA
ncbi:hypothetical protein SB725_30835, partial [Pseudomonas sp. SIMBA_041]|uniref:hypothetical protein n=1 Tax=Pseudomonas sp. SIMBA_041 TaxID=3085782 RepID=UPI00397CB689